MARAKKTDRADARRRTRALLADGAPVTIDDSTDTGPAHGAPVRRSGLFGAFRSALRPVHVRDDIRAIPWLVTRTKAIWLPTILIVAAAVWSELSAGSPRDISSLAFNLFVFPPPIAAAFMAGVLTDRMSYLAGLLVGIVAGVVLVVHLAVGGSIPGLAMTPDIRAAYIPYSLVVSPLSGLAIGGFAGFYRRFLRVANPNAGSRRAGPRSARNAKAPARR